MKLHLPGVDIRKKVFADKEDERKRGQGSHSESNNHCRPVSKRPFEQRAISLPEPVELTLESLMEAPDPTAGLRRVPFALIKRDFRREQKVHHSGDKRPRKEIGRDHRENNRQSQRRKNVLCRSGQQGHGHKHNADTHCRDQRGNGNLLCTVQDGRRERSSFFSRDSGACSQSPQSHRRRAFLPRAPGLPATSH